MKKRGDKTKLIVALLIAAVVIVASALNNAQPRYPAPDAAFKDASPPGGKGLALLLNRVGYQSKVQNAPLQTMPSDAKVWLLLGPKTRFTKREGQQLLDWVSAGNTLIYCVERDTLPALNFHGEESAPASNGVQTVTAALKLGQIPFDYNAMANQGQGLPDLPPIEFDAVSEVRAGVKAASGGGGQFSVGRGAFHLAGTPGGTLARIPYGKGRVWALPNAWIFTNYGLAKADNAVLVTNLIRSEVKSGAVYFDERDHGEDGRPPAPDTLISRLKKPPISYALLQLLGAGLLAWAFASRRLGAATPLPSRGPVTRASQFAQAMGALFSKTHRPRAAAEIIGLDFRKRLAARVGLSPSERDEILARRAHELSGVPYEVLDRLLLQTRTPPNNETQALRDAQEMAAVLKRLDAR